MSRRSIATASVIVATAFVACTSVNSSIQQHSAVPVEVNQDAININTAEASELQRIPHIGEKLAADIIEFRERFGPFRRAEQLLLVNVSDARFREIRHLVRVD